MTWYVMRSLIVQRHVVAYKLTIFSLCITPVSANDKMKENAEEKM